MEDSGNGGIHFALVGPDPLTWAPSECHVLAKNRVLLLYHGRLGNRGARRDQGARGDWGGARLEGLGIVFASPSQTCTLKEAITFFLSPLPPKTRWVAAVLGPSVHQLSPHAVHVLILSTLCGFCHWCTFSWVVSQQSPLSLLSCHFQPRMGSGLDYVSAETACRSPQQVRVWAPYVTSGVSAGTGASGGVSAGGTGALVLRLPGGCWRAALVSGCG